jgi:hypothetical protein
MSKKSEKATPTRPKKETHISKADELVIRPRRIGSSRVDAALRQSNN